MSAQFPRTSRPSSPIFNSSAAASSAAAAINKPSVPQYTTLSHLFAAQNALAPAISSLIPERLNTILRRIDILPAHKYQSSSHYPKDLKYLTQELKGKYVGFDLYTTGNSKWNILHCLARDFEPEFQRAVISHMEPQEIARLSQTKTQSTTIPGHWSQLKPARLAFWSGDLGNKSAAKESFLNILATYCDFSLVDAYFNAKIKNKGSLSDVQKKKHDEFVRYLKIAIGNPEKIKSLEICNFFSVQEFLTSPFRDKEYQSLMHALHSVLNAWPSYFVRQRAQEFLVRCGKNTVDEYSGHSIASRPLPPLNSAADVVANEIKDDDL